MVWSGATGSWPEAAGANLPLNFETGRGPVGTGRGPVRTGLAAKARTRSYPSTGPAWGKSEVSSARCTRPLHSC
jgi:hypothetical protein